MISSWLMVKVASPQGASDEAPEHQGFGGDGHVYAHQVTRAFYGNLVLG